ncbi:MAG: hypothetical protein ABJN26_21240 [Stappiaceae bacterium]
MIAATSLLHASANAAPLWPSATAPSRDLAPQLIVSQSNDVRLDVRESITATGHSPVALQVRISPDGALRKGYIVIRDVPKGVDLTAGQMIGKPGTWVLSTSDLNSLRLILPAEIPADFTLDIELLGPKGKRIDKRNILLKTGKSVLKIREPVMAHKTAEPQAQSEEQSTGKQARLPRNNVSKTAEAKGTANTLSQADKERYRAHGDRLMTHGDIVAARAFYMRLAINNDAGGAFALATTFDPNYLKNINVFGMKGDVKEARKWYELAASLGSDKAKTILVSFSN